MCTNTIFAERISARLWIGDLFSQSTYVRTYVRGGSRSGMSRGMLLHTGYAIGRAMWLWYVRHTDWHIQICTTQILFDVLWWWRRRSGTWGHRGLDTTTPNSFYSKFANVTRATRASPAPAFFDAHAQSAHWREAKMHMRIPSKLINPCSLFLSTNGLEYSLLALQGLCIWQWNFFLQSSRHL